MPAGNGALEDDFWCGSPCDNVLHPFSIKKHNPFGAVSSPRIGTRPRGQGAPADTPIGVDTTIVNDRLHYGQADSNGDSWEAVRVPAAAVRVSASASLCHDQGLR